METKYCIHWFVFILLGTMIVACSDSQVAVTSTNTPATAAPTITPLPLTATIAPTATAIPLVWKQIYDGQGFERDTVTVFAADKTDPNVIYAGMKSTGVYKTIDGGLSWRLAHHGLVSTQVESLQIDSQSPQILYAGTMGGVFKTEDGGENWFRVGDGTYLLMDMQDNSHLYARDENGIYETKDQGNNWTTVYTLKKVCPNTISSWAIHPANGDMLFIGGGETCAGVYQSSDSGRNWALIGLEDKPNLHPLTIGLDEQGNYSIYNIFNPPTGAEFGLYVSHDGGANWSHTNIYPCDVLTSDPDNLSIIYCANQSSLFVQRGKGNPWQLTPGTQAKVYTTIHIDHPNGSDRIIAGGTNVATNRPYVGIFISTDGGISWAERDNGLGSTRAELKIDPLDSARIYLATYYAGTDVPIACSLYRSQDSGKNWSAIKGKVDWCGPVFDAANVFYMIEWGALQMSANGGKTWLWEPHGRRVGRIYILDSWNALPSYHQGGSESVSANPYIKGIVYDIGNIIYYSTGSGWQKSSGSEGLRDARLFYTDQSKMIYAIGRYHQAFSTDNGVTWQNCGEDVTASRSDTRLALDLQGSRLYLATPGQGVLVSTDKCGSWQPSNNGLTNLFVNTLAIDPNNIKTVYAGTDGGAYISYDAGATWGQVNDGLLGAVVLYSIAVDKDSNVYAATPYGVFKLEKK